MNSDYVRPTGDPELLNRCFELAKCLVVRNVEKVSPQVINRNPVAFLVPLKVRVTYSTCVRAVSLAGFDVLYGHTVLWQVHPL